MRTIWSDGRVATTYLHRVVRIRPDDAASALDRCVDAAANRHHPGRPAITAASARLELGAAADLPGGTVDPDVLAPLRVFQGEVLWRHGRIDVELELTRWSASCAALGLRRPHAPVPFRHDRAWAAYEAAGVEVLDCLASEIVLIGTARLRTGSEERRFAGRVA